ncbi:hypothetical protein U9M48_039827 [Paspalum notatum var. saurae]|uniref:Uncharacterized protein n=1 Tax=Paspalum notatum var. saurae TaxID=547442 RepID=A0AAQ3ULH6_PASNO
MHRVTILNVINPKEKQNGQCRPDTWSLDLLQGRPTYPRRYFTRATTVLTANHHGEARSSRWTAKAVDRVVARPRSRSADLPLAGPDHKGKKSITNVKHPTMRFMARWITIVVLPRDDIRYVTIEDLKILYAMWRKQKYAPVTAMLYHWMKLVLDENSISIMSFVTRIASDLRVLANAQVAFLPPDTPNLVTESHFIRAHFLCKNPSTDTYVMIYKGYNFEVPLPVP